MMVAFVKFVVSLLCPSKVSFSLGGLHSHCKCDCTMSFVLKLLNYLKLKTHAEGDASRVLIGKSLNSCMSMSKTNIQFHLAKVCLRKFS